VTKYDIQLRNPDTGLWETQHSIRPAYKFSTLRRRRYWFFSTTIGLVMNLTAAEKAAQAQAVKLAKRLYYQQPCRVLRSSGWNGSDTKDTVWQNGRTVLSAKQAAPR